MNVCKRSALLAMVLCFLLCACAAQTGIVGSWRAEANVIGAAEDNASLPDAWIIFCFEDDLTGTQTHVIGEKQYEYDFTYSLSDGILRMSMDDGLSWEFPCAFEGKKMILTMNHQNMEFERIS